MARILVVDDDRLVRNMLRGLLAIDEHEVIEASDGITALEKLYVETANCIASNGLIAPIELVLTDLVMDPGMDGDALTLEVRRLYPMIPVVLHSSHSDIARIAAEVGATAYIVKGIMPGLIRREVTRILESERT